MSEVWRSWEQAARVYIEKGQRQPRHEKKKPAVISPNDSSSHEKPLISLSARAIKVTLVVDPQRLVGVVVPNGVARVPFAVAVAGNRVIRGQFNAKSARRAIAMLAEHGIDNVAVIIQGKLVGNEIEEAGIAVNVKAAEPASERRD
jgi:hypothetical protein